MLDCGEVGFLPDGILDQLPAPAQLAGTWIGGIDMNIPRGSCRPRRRPGRGGFTVAQFTTKCGDGRTDHRGLQNPPGRPRPAQTAWQAARHQTRRHPPLLPGDAARTIIALLTVRDKVIAPPHRRNPDTTTSRPPKHWTNIDRDCETLRLAMQTLFADLGITTKAAAAT